MRRKLPLGTGYLDMVVLRDGRLVLGELKDGSASYHELRTALDSVGIRYGIVDETLKAMAQGARYQMLMAYSRRVCEPPKIQFHINIPNLKTIFKQGVSGGKVGEIALNPIVEKGQKLLTVLKRPQVVLEYPNGRRTFLHKLDSDVLKTLSGPNTSYDRNSDCIVAEIDGAMTRSITGVVAVHPVEECEYVGERLQKSAKDTAIVCRGDWRREIPTHVSSNVEVCGNIVNSPITATGLIVCHNSVHNHSPNTPMLSSEQSIFAQSISDYKIRSRKNVVISENLRGSTLWSAGSVIAGDITDCKMTISKHLVCENLSGGSKVFLGENYMRRKDLPDPMGTLQQYQTKLDAADLKVMEIQHRLKGSQKKVKKQLVSSMRSMKNRQKIGLIVRRFYEHLAGEFKEFNVHVEEYRELVENFAREKSILELFAETMKIRSKPGIIVSGTLDLGVEIHTANQSFVVNRTFNNVRIVVDELRGTFEIVPLKPVEEKLETT